jgi:hypothetical protein
VCEDGRVAAGIELVEVGGGTQTVTVDGQPEDRRHASSVVFHTRLISPDRMIPDQLIASDSYQDAVKVGELYAQRLAQHAERAASLAADLQM